MRPCTIERPRPGSVGITMLALVLPLCLAACADGGSSPATTASVAPATPTPPRSDAAPSPSALLATVDIGAHTELAARAIEGYRGSTAPATLDTDNAPLFVYATVRAPFSTRSPDATRLEVAIDRMGDGYGVPWVDYYSRQTTPLEVHPCRDGGTATVDSADLGGGASLQQIFTEAEGRGQDFSIAVRIDYAGCEREGLTLDGSVGIDSGYRNGRFVVHHLFDELTIGDGRSSQSRTGIVTRRGDGSGGDDVSVVMRSDESSSGRQYLEIGHMPSALSRLCRGSDDVVLGEGHAWASGHGVVALRTVRALDYELDDDRILPAWSGCDGDGPGAGGELQVTGLAGGVATLRYETLAVGEMAPARGEEGLAAERLPEDGVPRALASLHVATAGGMEHGVTVAIDEFRDGVLTDIADLDADALPDGWETRYGLDPNDPGDAGLDPDGDGLDNLEEFRRHSVPTLAASTTF